MNSKTINVGIPIIALVYSVKFHKFDIQFKSKYDKYK